MTDTRTPRADAVRNRRRILDAAREETSAHGPDAAMEDIARAAGVAVGTLYRHFPSKTELVAAVIDEFVEGVAEDAHASLERARAGAPAVDEVVGFLTRVTESAATNHAVKAAARGLGVEGHGDAADKAEAGAALAELLRLSQAAGDVREGITVDDVYILMSTVPGDQPAEIRARWLWLIQRGLIADR